jgi:hypothetical protein
VLTLWTDFHGVLDERDAVGEWASRDADEPKAKVAIGLLMDPLEGERVREANPPGGGGLDDTRSPRATPAMAAPVTPRTSSVRARTDR